MNTDPVPLVPAASARRSDQPEVGSSAVVWREVGVHPLLSFLTRTVAAARTVGFRFFSDQSYLHTLEADGSDDGLRESRWMWEAGQTCRFSPSFAEETISLREFAERFESLDWVHANPDHPIAHMRWYHETLKKTLDEVKSLGTCEMIRRTVPGSKLYCIIPPDATEAERNESLAEMNDLIQG